MPNPQEAIFKEGSNQFTYLQFNLKDQANPQSVKRALLKLEQPTKTNEVIAFGRDIWAQLKPDAVPEHFMNFEELNGVKNLKMPSTQGDIFFWIHSTSISDNFDRAQTINKAFDEIADCPENQTGFTYHDSKDLMGFEDGTANPKEDARFPAALIPDGEPGAGGSIVFSQKWVHNLAKFEARPVAEQEKIIGRTKVENEELEGDAMPADSHISRTDVKVDGEEYKIWRRSAPFNNGAENGLFFLTFACHAKRIHVQLERMLGITEDGIHDRIMEFSTPVTGAYWFAPSAEDLEFIRSE